jgi:pimeloyl-ACP methyl ester carboxylesterase
MANLAGPLEPSVRLLCTAVSDKHGYIHGDTKTADDYRWRHGLADGEARFDDIEKRLATAPTIGVPTITMEGDANGAPDLQPGAYASKFTGRYEHRTLTGGIGHNPPQEAPTAFTQAVIDVDRG